MLGHSKLIKSLISYQTIKTFRHSHTRAIDRLKSKNDEQNNKELLGRLKSITVMGERKVLPLKEPMKEEERKFSHDSLYNLLKFSCSDPLLWNVSTLSKIYDIPENYCREITRYVKPLVYYTTSEMEETMKIIKTPVVIDVERLQNDKKYLLFYQKLLFNDIQTKLNIISDYSAE